MDVDDVPAGRALARAERDDLAHEEGDERDTGHDRGKREAAGAGRHASAAANHSVAAAQASTARGSMIVASADESDARRHLGGDRERIAALAEIVDGDDAGQH